MNEDELNFDELLTDVQPPKLRAHYWLDRRGLPQYGIHDSTAMGEDEIEQGEFGWFYSSVSVNDANGAWENDADETGTVSRQEDYALRLANTMAAAPQLLRMVKRQRDELFWLTNTMDDTLQKDVDNLKQRAVHSCIADFVQRLAEWGFNNAEHTMLWEAMCSVIEAGERGELDDLIAAVDDDEADEYFKRKEE